MKENQDKFHTGTLEENKIVEKLNPLHTPRLHINPLNIAPTVLMDVARVAGLDAVEKDPDAAWMKWVDSEGIKQP